MQDREDTIHQAYRRTYEWPFCDPIAEQKPWDNFRNFLSGDADIYWITGKAGSGKICVKLKEATALTGRSGDVFRAENALLHLLVLRIKTFAEESFQMEVVPYSVFPLDLESLVHYTLRMCRKAEEATGKAQTCLVMELDETMTYFYNNVYNRPSTCHWSDVLRPLYGYNGDAWGSLHQFTLSQSDMLSLAVRHRLVRFVKENETVGESIKNKPGRPLLDYALRPGFSSTHFGLRRSSEMVAFLLDRGAQPNQKFGGEPLMELFIWDLRESLNPGGTPITGETAKIIVLLLPYVQECELEAPYLKQLADILSAAHYGRDVEEDVAKAVRTLYGLYREASQEHMQGGLVEPVEPRPVERSKLNRVAKKIFCCFGG